MTQCANYLDTFSARVVPVVDSSSWAFAAVDTASLAAVGACGETFGLVNWVTLWLPVRRRPRRLGWPLVRGRRRRLGVGAPEQLGDWEKRNLSYKDSSFASCDSQSLTGGGENRIRVLLDPPEVWARVRKWKISQPRTQLSADRRIEVVVAHTARKKNVVNKHGSEVSTYRCAIGIPRKHRQTEPVQ